MLRPSSRLRRLGFVASILVASVGAGCSSTEPIVQPNVEITGNYVATWFKVTPTGKPTIDVLARGGSLALSIAANKTTSGTLYMPRDVIGDEVTASMAGTVQQNGYALRFQQSAVSFVAQVGWLAGGGTIATDVNDGSARIEVILTRQ